MTQSPLTLRIIEAVTSIPEGKVFTYGGIAALAGNRCAARQVVRVLHTCSGEGMPWHRVVNREGRISLRPGSGYEEQKARLEAEGVEFDASDTIDFDRFLWQPGNGLDT